MIEIKSKKMEDFKKVFYTLEKEIVTKDKVDGIIKTLTTETIRENYVHEDFYEMFKLMGEKLLFEQAGKLKEFK